MAPKISLSGDGASVMTLCFRTGSPDNAITTETIRALLEAVHEVAATGPRVLVLDGADSFSSGADPEEMRDLDLDGFRSLLRWEIELFHAVEALPCATLAVLRGLCLGTGAELALACDLRLAEERMRFSYPEVRLGFAGPAGRLARYVGVGVARDLLLSGRLLRATEAKALGIVTDVVAADQLDAAADELAATLCGWPREGIAATKVQLARVMAGEHYPDDDLMRDAEAGFAAAQTPDGGDSGE